MPLLELKENITLESGKILENPHIQYHTYGRLNEDRSNVVWVCHALTANSDVFDWWSGLFGEDDYFNPKEHFIVCANVLGSHYGSTGPLSTNPSTQKPYYHQFPEVTIRDMVALHIKLSDYLGIENIQFLIGGSMGGHQALEWSIIEPLRIKNMCLLATSAIISPWAAALNHTQRMAIENDPTWKSSSAEAGLKGMGVARAMALLSYRNQHAYDNTQKEDLSSKVYSSKSASYQSYQGQKLIQRFNAYSYWHLAKAMDSHNVGRNRGAIKEVLHSIKAATLILTIQDDLLFPHKEQVVLHEHIPNSIHFKIPSKYGHDGFLIEVEGIKQRIQKVFDAIELTSTI